MADLQTRLDDLEGRIGRLDAQNRRLRAGILVAIVVSGLPFLYGWTQAQKAVQAERFEVVRGGKVVAVLGANDEGGLVSLSSTESREVFLAKSDVHGDGELVVKSGRDYASFGVFAQVNGAYHRITNREGKIVAQTDTDPDGHGRIYAIDSSGKTIAGFGRQASGSNVVYVNDRQGRQASLLGANTSNHGFVIITNSTGKIATKVTCSESGQGGIEVFNASGSLVGFMVADVGGKGQIGVNGAAGQKRGLFAVDSNTDRGFINLFGLDGSPVWSAPGGQEPGDRLSHGRRP